MIVRFYAFILALLVSNQAGAAEWKEVVLSGEYYTDWRYDPGVGDRSWSFALEKNVDQSGDIWLEVKYSKAGGISFRINGYRFYDLGPLKHLPEFIEPPEKFDTSSWGGNEPRYMLLGHYYVLAKRKFVHATVVQILDFRSSGKRKTYSGILGGYRYKSKCTLTFRYLDPTATSLDHLNQVLSSASLESPELPPDDPSGEIPPQQPSDPGNDEAEPLRAEYEGFQRDTSDFLDFPLDQASVVKCDKLIDNGTAVKSKINQEMTLLREQVRQATADVEKYKDRITRVSNLQLKDRVATKINQLEANNQKRRVKLKEWEARQIELGTSINTLREYRDILK